MIPVKKLEEIVRSIGEIDQALCDSAVISDSRKVQSLNKERSDKLPLVECFNEWREVAKQVREDKEALEDPELGPLAREELPELEGRLAELERKIHLLLLPKDPNDERNTILEIRSGTGGEEAALFAADLLRMYSRYAERRGWKVELMTTSEASAGGLKEAIALVSGNNVYSSLRYEGGVHRVQRVPETEAQGRVHTSTATVAVLPEADEVDVEIDESDLKIDIAAASGPGGQAVNTTNSAVQITHIPSGLMVQCQDERSQHKNKSKALKVLRSRLLELEQRKQHDAIRDERRGMVGSGERSEKIRTYNFPQNRITDHRVGLTLHKLDKVIGGDIEEIIEAVRTHDQAERLKNMHGNDSSST